MKTKLYMKILLLRKYLQRIAQVSYSYSQTNKAFSPLEKQDLENLKELYGFYLGLIDEVKETVRSFETEYEKGLHKSPEQVA